MSLECLHNGLYLKTKFVEKKASLTGSSETAIKEYMNGAIYIESGTESECDLHSRTKSSKSFVCKQFKDKSNEFTSKTKINFAKIVAKSIQQEMLASEIENKEIRMQEAQKQYNAWLEKKKKEKADKCRMEMEKIREKEKKLEAEKKFRTIQSDLKYRLWLKKKEQEELEQQWKQLKLLLETNIQK